MKIEVTEYAQSIALPTSFETLTDDLKRLAERNRAYYIKKQWCDGTHSKSSSYRPYRRGKNRCVVCGRRLQEAER